MKTSKEEVERLMNDISSHTGNRNGEWRDIRSQDDRLREKIMQVLASEQNEQTLKKLLETVIDCDINSIFKGVIQKIVGEPQSYPQVTLRVVSEMIVQQMVGNDAIYDLVRLGESIFPFSHEGPTLMEVVALPYHNTSMPEEKLWPWLSKLEVDLSKYLSKRLDGPGFYHDSYKALEHIMKVLNLGKGEKARLAEMMLKKFDFPDNANNFAIIDFNKPVYSDGSKDDLFKWLLSIAKDKHGGKGVK